MKLIAACDGRDMAEFLALLARTVSLHDAEVLFAHVIDDRFEEDLQQMTGHHWLGRRSIPREHSHVHEVATQASHEILDEALVISRDWPAVTRRTVELQGNPERALVRLALEERADLLAVGQHRLELGPHAIGRCARFVIDHAPCTVLVVRGEAFHTAAGALLGHRLAEPRGAHRPPADR